MASGPRLHLIIDTQRTERCRHHAVGGADHHRRAEIVDEEVEKGHQHVEHQEAFGKGAQAKLLAEFHQQQVNRHVGHHVHCGQPGDFGGPRGKGPLQVLQVGGHDRITQRAGQAHQQPDDAIGNAFRRTVNRRGRRAEQRGFLMRRPVMRAIGITLAARHYFFSSSRSSFSSTR